MSESGKKQLNHLTHAQEDLAKLGLADEWETVASDDYTLQLDFDVDWKKSTVPINQEVWSMLTERNGHPLILRMYMSKGGHTHVLIGLVVKMSELERAAWQACLQSDPVREAGHLLSISRGELNPIVLYMNKKRTI